MDAPAGSVPGARQGSADAPAKPDGPVRQLPATARGRRTRERLLNAAEAVFGERGYHEASIVDITQRAKVALGTFYVYFPDKKAAFEELVRTLNRRLRAEIRAAVAELEDRLEQELVGFWTFFRFVQRHRNLYRIIRQAEFVDESLYRWHYRTLQAGYIEGLKRAQAAGQVRPDLDPEALAYLLMGMAEALGMRWVLWENRVPGPSVRRTLAMLLESGLRDRARPPQGDR
jgi:AcrR family transcriptional regulator